jgi:two-component system chemotaxis response regulator CheY
VKHTVLLVDDSIMIRTILKGLLVQEGWEVVGEAENGREALDLYRSLKPDLVILDITMPEMDGLTALVELLTIDKDAKVVMCSAVGDKGTVFQAIRSGAKDFIIKPFDNERIVPTLQNVMKNRDLSQGFS